MLKIQLLFLLGFISLHSQNWIRVDSIFSPSGVTVQSFSCPAFADMNADGKADLFMGSTGNRVDFFRNVSTGLPPKYSKDDSLLNSIYSTGAFINAYYPALIDLDDDRDLDLVIGGYNGFQLFFNGGDSTAPVWKRDTSVFFAVNSVIGTDAKPAFADLDADGDYDLVAGIGESLFGGPTPGICMGFRNNGTTSNPVFVQDNALVQGLPDAGLNAYPVFADVDNDGDFDVTIGRDVQLLLHYKNTGTRQAPVWTSFSSIVSGIASSTYWNDPTWFDLDSDGDLDLIYGNADGNLTYYKNTGSPSSPVLQIDNTYFKVIKVDGNAATVSLTDYDKDGDYDFLSGIWSGKFLYFKNNGSVSNPTFAITGMTFSSLAPGSYSYPAFGDIDSDGDPDIVDGVLNGKIYVYINNNYSSFTYNSSILGSVNVSGFASPAIADINRDGKPDVLVGAETGSNSRMYQNMGSGSFIQNDTLITGVSFYSNTRPTFSDFDNDGDFDLVIGRTTGTLICYQNTGTAALPQWQRNDALFSEVKVKQNAAPGFADLDGDGKKDLIVGEYNGNFTFYKNNMAISAVEEKELSERAELIAATNYPNPVHIGELTYIRIVLAKQQKLSVSVFDILGRDAGAGFETEYPAGQSLLSLDASGLSSGIYLYKITAEDGRSVSGKFIVVK